MKSNELMIGDLIRFFSKYDCGIGKVAGIEPREGSAEPTTFTIIKDKKMLIGVSRNWVKPITITADILEKNGFEKDPEDGTMCLAIGDFEEVTWRADTLKIYSLSASLELISCVYVHQLQHAMRLCGIEKEIEP